jgi:hypothetical protein
MLKPFDLWQEIEINSLVFIKKEGGEWYKVKLPHQMDLKVLSVGCQIYH